MVWVGDPITQPNLPTEISKSPNYPIFVTQFQWEIWLPNPIYLQITKITQYFLPGLTWFTNWNLQSWNVQNYQTLCYSVWVGNIIPGHIILGHIILTLHLKSPHVPCQILHPIVTIFNQWHHFPTWFTTISPDISTCPFQNLAPYLGLPFGTHIM